MSDDVADGTTPNVELNDARPELQTAVQSQVGNIAQLNTA